MSRKDQRKSMTLPRDPRLLRALRSEARRARSPSLAAAARRLVRRALEAGFAGDEYRPEGQGQPILLQLDPETRHAVETLARCESVSLQDLLMRMILTAGAPPDGTLDPTRVAADQGGASRPHGRK